MQNGHLTGSHTNSDRGISPWLRLWDARSAIIFAYLFQFAFVFSLAWPFADRLGISSYRHSGIVQTPGDQSLLLFVERLRFLLPTIQEQSLSAVGITLLYLLLVPLVSMIWIYAIDEPRSLQASMIKAAHCYHASLVISLFFLLAIGASIALIFGLGWSVHRGLWFIINDRIRDIVCFAVVLPASFSILYLVVSFDMARTALCHNRQASSAIRYGLAGAFRTKSILSYLLWFGCASLLTTCSALLFVFFEYGFRQSLFASFILLQTIAFARILLRGRWLVSARNIVHRIDKFNVRNRVD